MAGLTLSNDSRVVFLHIVQVAKARQSRLEGVGNERNVDEPENQLRMYPLREYEDKEI
jgi:hypothetical protein